MAGLVNYSAVLQDADGSNLRFVANEHKFQTWGAGQSGTSGLSGILAEANQTTVMTIRGSNVGIGVTLPVAKLQVAGGVGIGTAYAAIAPPADGCIIAGNVGIGTTNPVATLQVAGSVGIGAAYAAFVPPADGCIVAGNVGIGTTNPLARLHVNGTIKATQLAVSGILIGFAYQNTNTLYTLTGGFANTGVTVTYTPKSNNSTLIVVANLQLELVRASGIVSRCYLNIYRDTLPDTSANNKKDVGSGSFQHSVLHQSGGATNIYAYNTTTITHQWVNTSTTTTTFQVYGYTLAGETTLINANGRSEMYVFELLN